MGQITLTPKQRSIFNEVKNSDFIKANFYFTGGTALSAVYLHHRLSEDLDFFSEKQFDNLSILNLLTSWGKKYNFKFLLKENEVVKIYLLEFSDREALKVDFVDLYFLLKEFTIWDLMEGVRIKFRMKADPFLVGINCFKVDTFDVLPTMLVPLELDELKDFYRDLAKKLGMKAVKK